MSLLFRFIFIAVASHIALIGCRVTTSLYALSLHSTPAQVGVLIGLFSLFPMIFAVPIGRLIDRIGIVRPMICGATMMLLGCSLPAAISGITILYLAVALIGAGFLALHVSSLHAVGAISTVDNRAAHFGWLGTGYSVSSFLGPMVTGFIIDHTHSGSGHSTAYLTLAAFPAIVLMFIALSPLMPFAMPAEVKTPQGSILNLLREPGLRRVYFVGTLLTGAWDLYSFVLPIQGVQMGLSASAIGVILGAFALATFIVRLAMYRLSHWFSAWQIIATALTVTVLCYALLPLAKSAAVLLMLSFLLGLALGSGQPNMLTLLHQGAPAGRAGEAIGIRVTISNASQVMLPLAFGVAGATLGLFAVFWSMGAIISSGLPIAWRLARQVPLTSLTIENETDNKIQRT